MLRNYIHKISVWFQLKQYFSYILAAKKERINTKRPMTYTQITTCINTVNLPNKTTFLVYFNKSRFFHISIQHTIESSCRSRPNSYSIFVCFRSGWLYYFKKNICIFLISKWLNSPVLRHLIYSHCFKSTLFYLLHLISLISYHSFLNIYIFFILSSVDLLLSSRELDWTNQDLNFVLDYPQTVFYVSKILEFKELYICVDNHQRDLDFSLHWNQPFKHYLCIPCIIWLLIKMPNMIY